MNEQSVNIEAIIFDMGRVLVAIDDTYLVQHLFKGLSTDDLQQLGQKTMSDPAMVEFNSGRMASEVFHRRMCGTYDLDLDLDTFCTTWCGIFHTMEGIEQLVGQLKQRFAIGLLSDTDPIHWNFIKTTWPWIGAIQNPTLSYQVGIMKPAPKIYQTAAANVNTPPKNCLYIDDLQANVDAARDLGMTGIRFENPTQLAHSLNILNLI
jgi:putative hydrolase of the HAD superfamily